MLQCVAVLRGVLQCVAVCYSVLQCVTVCCSVLQCVGSMKKIEFHKQMLQLLRRVQRNEFAVALCCSVL